MKQDLVIDLGSKNTVIIKKDAGVVLKEPTVLIVTNSANGLKPVACGGEAMKLIGKTEPSDQVVYPIEQGVIINEKACELLLQDFVYKVVGKSIIKPKISAIVCLSCGLTNLEKKSFEEVCNNVGIKEVTLVESAIGLSGLIHENGALVIEIGASKTELAIVSEQGIVTGCSVDIGGDKINSAITDYIAGKHKMIVHYNTTEKIKQSIASMRENDISQVAVNGRSIIDGELKTVKISASELRESFLPVIDKLVEVIENITYMIPDNMAEQIALKGVYLSGGTALLVGLDDYIAKKLSIKVNLMPQPDDAVALGASRYLYNKQRLNKMLNVENLNA